MRRERVDTDLELSFAFSLVFTPGGLSTPLHVQASTAVFTSSCTAVNRLFSCFFSRAYCSNGVFIWVPSTNYNSLSIRCWYISILNPGVPNYFTDHEDCYIILQRRITRKREGVKRIRAVDTPWWWWWWWNHVIVCKLLLLDRNTWNYIAVEKDLYFIVILETLCIYIKYV